MGTPRTSTEHASAVCAESQQYDATVGEDRLLPMGLL